MRDRFLQRTICCPLCRCVLGRSSQGSVRDEGNDPSISGLAPGARQCKRFVRVPVGFDAVVSMPRPYSALQLFRDIWAAFRLSAISEQI